MTYGVIGSQMPGEIESSGTVESLKVSGVVAMKLLAVTAMLLLVSTSIVPAIQPGFIGYKGDIKTFPFRGTAVRVNGSNFMVKRTMGGSNLTLQAIFTLTEKTVYVGGSQAGLVPGAHVRVSFHFDASNSDIAYADTVQFLSVYRAQH
jgi:hypothetical protein